MTVAPSRRGGFATAARRRQAQAGEAEPGQALRGEGPSRPRPGGFTVQRIRRIPPERRGLRADPISLRCRDQHAAR